MSAPLLATRELMGLALDTARDAAALVRDRRAGVVEVADTKSTPTDVVTEADRATEALIRERLGSARPDDAIVGEEGDDVAGSTGVRWIVDPIDGTVNFLYGIPRYAVSIAAEVDGELSAGVVVDVAVGTEYTAYAGELGVVARRNGEPISVRPPADLSQRLIATGFHYDADLRRLQAEAMVRFLPRIRDIRRIGSAALDICSVAEGTVDGYVEEGVNLWDYAAAVLVARGAGAEYEVTTGIGGKTLVVCAPRHGFGELRAAVGEVGLVSPDAV